MSEQHGDDEALAFLLVFALWGLSIAAIGMSIGTLYGPPWGWLTAGCLAHVGAVYLIVFAE